MQDDNRAKEAYQLYCQGQYGKSFAIYAEILKRNPEHMPSRLGYAEEVARRGLIEEALNLTLEILVHFEGYSDAEENKEYKRRAGVLFAKCLSRPGIVQKILKLLQGVEETGLVSALNFLGYTALQYSEIPGSIELYQSALRNSAEDANTINNILEAREVAYQLDLALKLASDFLRNYPDLSVGGVSANHVLQAWQTKTFVAVEPYPPKLSEEGQVSPYSEKELNLLNIYFKIVKLLYSRGDIGAVRALVYTTLPAKNAGGDLHFTVIRNANSYFEFIKTLIDCEFPFVSFDTQKRVAPIYVMGDSHSLSLGWRSIRSKTDEYWFKPMLVTGCKIWHLRKESQFYPKANFYHVLKEIPKNNVIIMMFGEIDCRESILQAVADGIYSNIEEGIQKLIDIYIEVLNYIVAQKNPKVVYIHPVPPVLNETRSMVLAFNQMLQVRLMLLKNKSSKIPIQWLPVDMQLLTEEHTALKESYKLDGTHLNPNYLAILSEFLG